MLRDQTNLTNWLSEDTLLYTGNFYRIRSAFTYGARKLGRILSQPEENIGDEIRKFFSNTLERHGKGQRPDVQDPYPMSGHNELSAASIFWGRELQESRTVYETESSYSVGITGEDRLNHGGTDVEISGAVLSDRLVVEPCKGSLGSISSADLSKPDCPLNGIAVSDNRLKGDAKDLATLRLQSLSISNDVPKSSLTSGESSLSPLNKAHYAPHLYFAQSFIGNGEMNDHHHIKHAEHDGSAENATGDQDESQLVNHKAMSPVGSKQNLSRLSSIALSSEDFYPSYSGYRMSAVTAGTPDPFNTLSDLSGDYESHLSSLQFGRYCYECTFAAAVPSMPPMLSPFQGKKSWDIVRQSVQRKHNVFSHLNTNGMVHRPPLYSMNPPLLTGGMGFAVEEMPKPRGTGTYFPNMNHYRDRPTTPRGRNQAPVRSPRTNGRLVTHTAENGFLERGSRDNAQAQISVNKGCGKSGSSDDPSDSPRRKANANGNGAVHQPEPLVEFGSIGLLQSEAPLLRGSWLTNSMSAPTQNSDGSLAPPGTEKLKPVLSMDQERIAVQSYVLKDEDDFPPLSV